MFTYIYIYLHIFTYIYIYLHIFTHIFPTCWNLYLHTDILSVVMSAMWTPTKGPSRWSSLFNFGPPCSSQFRSPQWQKSRPPESEGYAPSHPWSVGMRRKKPWGPGGVYFYLRG